MKATEVTAGLEESNGSLLPGLWRESLHVPGGLTACTPGSAPGPTLGNEYGKTLPLTLQKCGYFFLPSVAAKSQKKQVTQSVVSLHFRPVHLSLVQFLRWKERSVKDIQGYILHEVHETTTFLLITLPNIYRFNTCFYRQTQQ